MKTITKMLFMLSALFCLSCSGPMGKEYSEETAAEDLKAIVESEDLTKDETATLAGWIMGASFVEDRELNGKTYADILDDANSYRAEQEALAAKAKAEAEAKAKRLREAATVSIFDKVFERWSSYEKVNGFKYAIENKSEKDIDALKFSFSIHNKLGDEIGNGYSVSITDNPIPAGEEYSSAAYWDYNPYIDSSIAIKNADYEDLVFNITLEKIVYTDGTILE